MLKLILKIIRGQLLCEKMRFENRIPKASHTFFLDFSVIPGTKFVSVLEPRVTPNVGLGFLMFSKSSYFCMWNFDWWNKAHLEKYPN